MTQKHFIALADAIKAHNDRFGPASGLRFGPEQLYVLAEFCAKQNPRFNWERWMSYIEGKCGPNGGKH